jgi:FKBP-type peptidyl-prolyl cis-trans isomerase
VVVGLDEGVRTMSLGEKCELKCRYDALYTNYSMGPNIPPRANMLLTVELCQVTSLPAVS